MDYRSINKELWNARTRIHIDSDFYNMQKFIEGETSLPQIDRDTLGDLTGLKLLHLQCHFGQDTLSMARMGAKVTGVDLSDEAIGNARRIAEEIGIDAHFINCDLYDLPEHLDDSFDIVYTSYGTIGWLPDLDRWAAVVARYLKPGGRFVFFEFHPVVWMFDPQFQKIEYSYFKAEPIVETEQGTYADLSADIALQSVSWNHSIHETVGALLRQGLVLKNLVEYPHCTYNIFPDMIETAPGEFHLKGLEGMLPMVYSLEMTKAL